MNISTRCEDAEASVLGSNDGKGISAEALRLPPLRWAYGRIPV